MTHKDLPPGGSQDVRQARDELTRISKEYRRILLAPAVDYQNTLDLSELMKDLYPDDYEDNIVQISRVLRESKCYDDLKVDRDKGIAQGRPVSIENPYIDVNLFELYADMHKLLIDSTTKKISDNGLNMSNTKSATIGY